MAETGSPKDEAIPIHSETPTKKQKIESHTGYNEADDLRIREIKPLIPPQILMEDIPLSSNALHTVKKARKEASDIIKGLNDRLLVICGPCSIHDPVAALEYSEKLLEASKRLKKDLCIIMRVYFEKPRTTVGWKGLINDPFMDSSFQINKGLKIGRKLLLDMSEKGVPAAVEFLDTITPQFLADLVAWGAIGARTTESQIHRELASGLSCPVGFKNATDGGIQVAIDAMKTAQHPHSFLSVTKQGLSAIVSTKGNDSCHIILRGGKTPNYSKQHVSEVSKQLEASKMNSAIMIDCSHGNSQKDFRNQPKVCSEVAKQVSEGATSIVGVMIESHLVEGRQDIPQEGTQYLKYGQSITDGCVSWKDTIPMLEELAKAVQTRRSVHSKENGK